MNILRLCGHDTSFPDELDLTPIDRRWMQTSDCTECRTDPDWEPSDGHLSREDFLGLEMRARSMGAIRESVCRHFHISIDEIRSKSREVRICLPRQIGMYLTKTLTDHTYKQIAPVYGRVNHATVLHAKRKIIKRMAKDEALRESVEEIKRRIESGIPQP